MKVITRLLSFFIFILISISNAQSKTIVQKNSSSYLNQNPPGMNAEIFAPGIISTGMSTRDIAITPDGKEIYFVVFGPAFTFSTICFTKDVNGVWTKPEVAPFAKDSKYKYIEPCISHDGKKLFFATNKTNVDSTGGKNDFDIWFVDRIGDSWSEPKNLGIPICTSAPEFFPSITKTGTIYFTREQADGTNLIMRSKLVDGKYTEPEKLPEQINFGRDRFNAFIDPDENYIIVSVYGAKDGIGATDYWIVFRNPDDTWNEPINMGNRINSQQNEYSPYVTRDEKYFFFMSMKTDNELFKDKEPFSYERLQRIYNSPGNGNSTTYWIDAKIIDELRKTILK